MYGTDHEIKLFTPGSAVIYGLHGRCTVKSVEKRTVAGVETLFYRLEIVKAGINHRSTRHDPAIWVPVETARAKGLREVIAADALDSVFLVLGSKEAYFDSHQSVSTLQPLLESAIRTEGVIGLAKALGTLAIIKKRQVVISAELNKLHETVSKHLFRELSEVSGEASKAIEEKANKLMRPRIAANL